MVDTLAISFPPSSLPADLIVRRALSGADPIWEGSNVGGRRQQSPQKKIAIQNASVQR